MKDSMADEQGKIICGVTQARAISWLGSEVSFGSSEGGILWYVTYATDEYVQQASYFWKGDRLA